MTGDPTQIVPSFRRHRHQKEREREDDQEMESHEQAVWLAVSVDEYRHPSGSRHRLEESWGDDDVRCRVRRQTEFDECDRMRGQGQSGLSAI